jgi:hypothetical protein
MVDVWMGESPFWSLRRLLSGTGQWTLTVSLTSTVMFVECPHCYMRVIPNSEGECPACRNNIHDTADTDPTKASISVRHLADLPPYCCDCGRQTDRFVKVIRKVSHKMDGPDASSAILLVLGMFVSCFFLPLALVLGLRERKGDVIVVRMPQCKSCAMNGTPVPIRVNSEQLQMTFVVNKDLKDRTRPRIGGRARDAI